MPSSVTRLMINTDDARRPAAEVDALAGDGWRAFQMHESSRYRKLPEHAALVESQTVQDGAVGLVHAVAEDQLAVVDGGRTDGRQFQIRRRLRPGDALGRFRIDVQARQDGNIEAAQSGDEQMILVRDGCGDEVIGGLPGPEYFGRGRSWQTIAARPLRIAPIGGNRLGGKQ